MYVMGLSHGLFSGTDTATNWAQPYYWISGGSLLFLLFMRIVGSVMDALFPVKKPTPLQRMTQG
jgi:hypothetical protein